MINEERRRLITLAKIDKEIKRRKGVKIYSYNTGEVVHKKQILFHQNKARNRWVFGGNRSGKTECGAVECVYMARGIHPYRENRPKTEGWVVSLSTRVQKDVAQKKILDYLDKKWIVDVVMQSGNKANAVNGLIEKILVRNVSGEISTIGFKSIEEGREKFQGASLDYVWFDEEPSKDIYEECVMRVMDKCGDIFCTMTPLKGKTFVYNDIYLNSNEDPETFCMFMQWEDNPFLHKSEIKRLEKMLAESELEKRKYGRFVEDGEYLVYSEFDENENVVDPFEIPREWQDTISIDPGLANPLSAHWYAVDPYTENIYVVAEHYEANRTVEHHADKIKEICEGLNWKTNWSGGYDALIDSAGTQTTLNGQKSVVKLFAEQNINVNPRVNKDVFSGVNVVKRLFKNALGERHLFIFKNCSNLIREIKSYHWSDAGNPVKKDDHALDELRYYCNRESGVKKPEAVKSVIQKDKEKLYKKILRGRRDD